MHQHKHKSFMSNESERDASTRKGEILILVLALVSYVRLRRGRLHGEIGTLMLALVLATVLHR